MKSRYVTGDEEIPCCPPGTRGRVRGCGHGIMVPCRCIGAHTAGAYGPRPVPAVRGPENLPFSRSFLRPTRCQRDRGDSLQPSEPCLPWNCGTMSLHRRSHRRCLRSPPGASGAGAILLLHTLPVPARCMYRHRMDRPNHEPDHERNYVCRKRVKEPSVMLQWVNCRALRDCICAEGKGNIDCLTGCVTR